MKHVRNRLVLLSGAMALVFGLAACDGPVGPQGPEGRAGADGEQGPAGAPGQDALNLCGQCHSNDATIVAISRQFNNSGHWTGNPFDRDGNTCNMCHTHQGFINVFVEGKPATSSVPNAAQINCRTCHEIHTTYTGTDYKLTTTAPLNLTVGGTVDLKQGNLCGNCHQARAISPMPVVGGSPVTITNFRWGPHYGTQANVAGASGLFRFPGPATIPTTPMSHGVVGCQECHMVPAIADWAGGHVFRLSYTTSAGAKVELVRACTQCHSTATNFNYLGFQTITKNLMAELGDILRDRGIMRPDGYAVTGTFPANVAAAFLNYRMIYYDRSYGVHHPDYVHAVLVNTLHTLKQ
jgi:hypothetical protein